MTAIKALCSLSSLSSLALIGGCSVSDGSKWQCSNNQTGQIVGAEPWGDGESIRYFEYADGNGLEQRITGEKSSEWKCKKVTQL